MPEDMNRVVAAGLSPAWQQVAVVGRLRPGEVNRLREAHWCASGKVLNAGLALHHASGGAADATMTLSTAGGTAYQLIDDDLTRMGVPHRLVRTASPTRVCTTVLEMDSGAATELVENAHPISPAELREFRDAFAETARHAAAVVLTGSTPPGTPVDVFRDLVKAAPAAAVLDVRGPQLLSALEAKPFLVKPNRQELAETFGRAIDADEDLHAAMRELCARGATCAVVTAGRAPTWVLYGGELHKLTPTPVERVVNPIGCGDCLAAGIAWALTQGTDPVEAVRRGMDLAAANLATLLPARF